MISLEALRLHNTFAPANACVELTGIVTHRSSQISIPKQADVVVSLNTIWFETGTFLFLYVKVVFSFNSLALENHLVS